MNENPNFKIENKESLQIKNQNLLGKEAFPQELEKEIKILLELGLEDYEIEYIIYLKTKEKSSLKWRH